MACKVVNSQMNGKEVRAKRTRVIEGYTPPPPGKNAHTKAIGELLLLRFPTQEMTITIEIGHAMYKPTSLVIAHMKGNEVRAKRPPGVWGISPGKNALFRRLFPEQPSRGGGPYEGIRC